MSTKKQTKANTGPKTAAGKARSSMNHLRTGLYATTLVLPDENQAQFDELHCQYQTLYQPQDIAQQDLVDQLTAAKWKMRRVELIEAGILIERGDDDASTVLPIYDRVLLVQARLQRLWLKLYNQLETIKNARQIAAREAPAEKLGQPASDDEQWSLPEEYYKQTGKERNFKRAKYLEVTWTPVKGEPPRLISRIYKGKNVPEWPADDPPGDNVVYRRL